MKREWLIKLRKMKKMTQKEISTIAFIDRSYYTLIENGKRTPSIAIAKAIAAALDFDPLLFFHETAEVDFNNSHQLMTIPDTLKIAEVFKSEKNCQILYVSTNFDDYLKHVITFILVAYEKGNHYMIFDTVDNIRRIKEKLELILPEDDLLDHIYFINHECDLDEIDTRISSIVSGLNKDASLFIGCRMVQSTIVLDQTKLKESISLLRNRNILFTCVYDANLLKAGSLLQLMKAYPYLMTDSEIVLSPLFNKAGCSDLLPTLFIHEESDADE
ncbi:helix-turn-helix transcriptional regulator [Neobacillus sp. MM2021_6]|uniref:helix-turn-helix domain-containing protein n=1 Tax=Bacillaceae TaxID=186817 RepID=UPI00140B71F4|nr:MULTISPECIES: helix-turn-helix transcriptional regulator [Bacillaceae]MBO0960905.1 helix-turn-helix transcriptional regulator [Neobacillus sp. MM2021_6]NHC21476.1 helix-turn-helix transcriptional regulator [Bacillus sp. MM2020_4]